jgi:hypothetical protein
MSTVERSEQKQWDEYKEKLEKFFTFLLVGKDRSYTVLKYLTKSSMADFSERKKQSCRLVSLVSVCVTAV